jgi:hypothetical protein
VRMPARTRRCRRRRNGDVAAFPSEGVKPLLRAAVVKLAAAKSGHAAMLESAGMRTLGVWYSQMSEEAIRDAVRAAKEISIAGTKG